MSQNPTPKGSIILAIILGAISGALVGAIAAGGGLWAYSVLPC
jgi:hypothetical protein